MNPGWPPPSVARMEQPDDVTFYLEPGLLESAQKGEHNFIGLVASVLQEAGLNPHYTPNTGVARLRAEARPGYALFHMDQPNHDRALTMRRAYFYPFWQIEASSKRWEWDVALTEFDPAQVDRAEADRFFNFWGRRLYQQKPSNAVRQKMIYVPLQGLIRQRRSFQWCSPVEMLELTAQRFPHHQIIATLHPNEDYTSADRMALAKVIGRHPKVEIIERPMELCLRDCDFVVTMNSSAAFNGFLFRKPAVLFGQIDFHHIAGSVMRDGEDAAFDAVNRQPDYAGYMWWFLQQMSINAGKDNAKERIKSVLRGHGWPV